MGQINKKIKKFLKDKEAYFTANFNPNLLKHALIYDCFGGELDLNNLHGFSKLIAKLATKNNQKPIKLNTENITKFIEKKLKSYIDTVIYYLQENLILITFNV